MSYFKQFPKLRYDFNRNGVYQNVIDIYRSVRPQQSSIDNVAVYKYYEIMNGERPDIVSQRLYDTPQYYWTFFIINEFLYSGLAAWPMSQEMLADYMNKEYEGYAITTNPKIIRNTDGLITNHRDSLSGRFQLGETVVGSISGATGTLYKKYTDLNQLIIKNVSGTFIGSPDEISNNTELLVGQTTGDSVSTYEVFKYLSAPNYYFVDGDSEKRIVDNGVFIDGGVAASNLDYVSNREYEETLNSERSRIRIIDPKYIDQFANEFKKVLNV